MKVLVIDNYDSFVYNLVQYIGELGGETVVYRNDQVTLKQAMKLKPDRIVISPGPGTPVDSRYFGVCSAILQHMSCKIPTLGVCLGHQAIAVAFGGEVVFAKRLMHGKTSMIHSDGKMLYQGIRNPFEAMRYHSLAVSMENFPECLEISSEADDGEIMGIRHRKHPTEGIQFHPESIMTRVGKRLLRNFLKNTEH